MSSTSRRLSEDYSGSRKSIEKIHLADWLSPESLESEAFLADSTQEFLSSRSLSASASATARRAGASTSSSTCSSLYTHSSGHASAHFGNHSLHDTEIILTYVSVVILAVFFVEQLLLIYELGKDWCKPMFVL